MKKQFGNIARAVILTSLLGMVIPFHFGGVSGLSVEGVITNDTVWTLEDSPIKVLDNVTVASGATLSIEPGIDVEFEVGSSLTINGSLYAVGTSGNPIIFSSSTYRPRVGDWNGIKFYGDGNSTFTMGFCDVEYAKDGVTVSSLGKVVIVNSTIKDSYLSGIRTIGVANLLVQTNIIGQNAKGISASGATITGLTITNNVFLDNENGIYLDADGDNSRISSVAILHNAFLDNADGIYLHSHARPTTDPEKANAYVNNVTISDNLMESGKHGIYLLAQAWGEPGLRGGGAYIYNSVISNNILSLSEYAIKIDSTSNWYSWISGLTISGNIIHSSDNGIFMHAFRTPQPPYQDIPFDVILVSNIISANGNGIIIFGDVTANFTGNSVSYNSYGIYLFSSVPPEMVARSNDIYQNKVYGVYVVENAAVKAEYNYWGAPSGPFHETLNPSGEGDRVNGNGENLDFEPFSTEPLGKINDAPFAVLKADRTMVPVNQTVVFDGSLSTDESSITKFFFDFGDGETTQVVEGNARHNYTSLGVYNASLVVKDDLGVNSTNVAIKTITVVLPHLVVSVFLNPLSVVSHDNVTVEVHVSDGEVSVPEAFVQLSSDLDGDFEPSSGHTDSEGEFQSTFSAPSVSEPLNIRITATASIEDYKEDSDEIYLPVFPRSSGEVRPDFSWIWFIAVIAVVAVVVAFFMKRKGKR